MELASKYNPADVEENGISIGWTTNFSVQNPTDVNLTPSSFLPLT